VKRLRIDKLYHTWLRGDLFQTHFGHFASSLRSIELSSAHFNAFPWFIHLICVFPHLDDLILNNTQSLFSNTQSLYSNNQSLQSESFPTLRGTLSLASSFDAMAVIPVLLRLPNQVRSSTIKMVVTPLLECQSLLHTCSLTLQILKLQLCDVLRVSRDWVYPLSLESNIKLKELELTFFQGSHSYDWTTRLLSTITSPHFTTLTFIFHDNGLTLDKWRAIDEILTRLCGRRSLGLKVVIRPRGGGYLPHACESLWLPTMKEKGFLELCGPRNYIDCG